MITRVVYNRVCGHIKEGVIKYSRPMQAESQPTTIGDAIGACARILSTLKSPQYGVFNGGGVVDQSQLAWGTKLKS